MAANATGNIIAIVLANSIPGQRAEPGRLSDTQEFVRAATIVIMLIYGEGVLN